MTYRPPLHKRWRFPFLLCLAVAGLWLGLILLLYTRSKQGGLAISIMMISGVAIGDLIRRSWLVWTTSVSVDETGLRWSRGSESHALRWDEISELGYTYTKRPRRLKIGPVRALSKMLHPLPMLPRALYDELKTRLGALPANIEADYYARQSS